MTSIEPRRPLGSCRSFHVLIALGLLAVAGCGGSTADGFSRFPVQGTVTLDGKPLKTGTITFNALGKGASSSGEVVEGAYRLGGDDGLSPGPYRVEIYSLQPTGKKVPSADDSGLLVDQTVSVVPRSYNIDSTLKAEIPAGGSKEPLSFALTGATQRGSGR